MGLDVSILEVKKGSKPEWSAGNFREYFSWSKPHAIHHWVVQNVQNGVDDQKEYPLTEGHLQELAAACQRALQHADELSGIKAESRDVFGGECKDARDFEKLEFVLDDLVFLLEHVDFSKNELYYSSSW